MKLPVFTLAAVATCACDTSHSRALLVGAGPAPQGRFGAVVRLGSCSGTKIAPRTYLTAKHCIQENLWRSGSRVTVERNYSGGEESALHSTVAFVAAHDAQDVAILRLKDDDSLPAARVFSGSLTQGRNVFLAGYGCVSLTVSEGRAYPSHAPGHLQFQAARLEPLRANATIDPTRFLYVKAGRRDFLSDAQVLAPSLCPGDSGGAVWIGQEGHEEIIGVASGFHPAMFLSIFVRTDRGAANGVHSWIGDVVRATDHP